MGNTNSTRKLARRKLAGMANRCDTLIKDLTEVAFIYSEDHPDKSKLLLAISDNVEFIKASIESARKKI